MTKCLVTNYGGVVNDDSLPRVGEFRIKQVKIDSPTSLSQAILLYGDNIDVEIIGDAYFTDSTLSDNFGKKQTNVNSKTLYISNNDCEIAVTSKYNIVRIYFRENTNWVNYSNTPVNKTLQLNNFKYSSKLEILRGKVMEGDLSNITSNKIKVLDIPNSDGVTGDISALKDMVSLSTLSLGNGVTGDISALKDMVSLSTLSLGNGVTGDISALKDIASLSSFYLHFTQVTGDVASIKSLSSLQSCYLPNSVTGSIDSLRGITTLNSIYCIYSTLTGDISVLANSLRTITASKNSHFTWSHRDSTAAIISLIPSSINGSMVIDNVDKMLQDQAQCVVPSGVTKTISVTGTRTSASDDAVATLQSKGYTVSITPA